MLVLLKIIVVQVVLINLAIAAPAYPCSCGGQCGSFLQPSCDCHQVCDPLRGKSYPLGIDRGPTAEASVAEPGSTGFYDTVIQEPKIQPKPCTCRPQPCVRRSWTPNFIPSFSHAVIYPSKINPIAASVQDPAPCGCQDRHQCGHNSGNSIFSRFGFR